MFVAASPCEEDAEAAESEETAESSCAVEVEGVKARPAGGGRGVVGSRLEMTGFEVEEKDGGGMSQYLEVSGGTLGGEVMLGRSAAAEAAGDDDLARLMCNDLGMLLRAEWRSMLL